MDATKTPIPLDSREQLKGFKGLCENPFFTALLDALDKEYRQNLHVVLSPDVTPTNQLIREQVIGECRGLKRITAILDATINGLIQEVADEVNKPETSTEVKQNETESNPIVS